MNEQATRRRFPVGVVILALAIIASPYVLILLIIGERAWFGTEYLGYLCRAVGLDYPLQWIYDRTFG